MDFQVIVVGAGPAGLMLACELRLMGVHVLLIEKRPGGTQGESRAPGINARTLEILSQRGMGERFRAAGRLMDAVVFAGIPIFPRKLDPDWPFGLLVSQSTTERLLYEKACELGVQCMFSTELLHATQDAAGVAVVATNENREFRLTANYLVGCDGGHSAVRRFAGIGFPGEDPQTHWLVADVMLDNPPSKIEPFGRSERAGIYQISQVEKPWHRVTVLKTVPPVDRNAKVSLEELSSAMVEAMGTDYGLSQARWASRFTDGFRHAESYRKARIFLAGDAAHVHAPFGGQGLNLGIQDAVNLGWKLAAVLLHGAPDKLLDSYEKERHYAGRAAMRLARAQTLLVKPGLQEDALRSFLTGFFDVPDIARYMSGLQSGLALRYEWGEGKHALVGSRMPDMAVKLQGKSVRLYELMEEGRPLSISFGTSAGLQTPKSWDNWVCRLNVQTENGFDWDFPVTGAVPQIDAILIRPDGFVVAVREHGVAQSIDEAGWGITDGIQVDSN